MHFKSNKQAIAELEAEINQLEKQQEIVAFDLDKTLWALQKPDCCFTDEPHIIIVTSDGKGVHMNAELLEEKCPMLKEIALFYTERDAQHCLVQIHSKIMKEVVHFMEYGHLPADCEIDDDMIKVAKMLEMEDLVRFIEMMLLSNVDFMNALEKLMIAVKYSMEFMKEQILNFIAMEYENFRNHPEWRSFAKGNFELMVEIMNYGKY